MTLKALLFDVDGTVADTESYGHRRAYNRAFRKLGLAFRWGPKLYRKLLLQPGGRERLLHYLHHYQPQLGPQAEAAALDEDAWVDQVHSLKSKYFRGYLRRGEVPLRPGVARLIVEAKNAGLYVALVSNASPASLKPLLRHALGPDLSGRIDLIVSGHEVRAKKPSPDPYLFALRQLRVAPWECVALEDSSMGLQAATAAGIPTVITRNENTAQHDFSSAAMVLEHLGDPELPAGVVRGRLTADHLTLDDLRGVAAGYARAA